MRSFRRQCDTQRAFPPVLPGGVLDFCREVAGSRRLPSAYPWFLLAACLLAAGCRNSPPEAGSPATAETTAATAESVKRPRPRDTVAERRTSIQFREVQDSSGISFTPRNGEEAGRNAILEVVGVGVGLFDFDQDGRLDVLIPGGGRFGSAGEILGISPGLFRQLVGNTFEDVSEQSGLTRTAGRYSHGAIAGDFDGDGFPDMLMTGFGGLALYRNQGDGTFVEIAAWAGLDDTSWSTAAGWGDLTGDGIADLYVVHYLDWSPENDPPCVKGDRRDICGPPRFNPLSDTLYVANGDGTFHDATGEMGLKPGGKGLGVLLADMDLDGDLDIYVGNDTTPNFLYINDGHGHLEENGLVSGTALNEAGESDGSMGVDVCDYDNDGLPDLWVANFEQESFALYHNLGHGTFQHVSNQVGISAMTGRYVGFGTLCSDFDRDGDEDLFTSNGHVFHYPQHSTVRQLPLLFENNAGKRFQSIAPQAGPYFTSPHMGRGAAVGDLDQDGDLDLVIAHSNEPVSHLSNESGNANHWLQLRLVGVHCQRDPIGAWVEVTSPRGRQVRHVKGGASYLSTSDYHLFFGLGGDTSIQLLKIHWPSGAEQELVNVAADRFLLIHEE